MCDLCREVACCSPHQPAGAPTQLVTGFQGHTSCLQGMSARNLSDRDIGLQVRYADTAEEKRIKRASKVSARPFSLAMRGGGMDLPAGFTSFGPQAEVVGLSHACWLCCMCFVHHAVQQPTALGPPRPDQAAWCTAPRV